MALVIRKSVKTIRYLLEECGDYRSERLPLMNSVFPIIFILSGYYYFVNVFGPKYMKNRKAYDLKNFMIAYNLAQVVINAVLFILGYFYTYYLPNFQLRCQNMSPNNDENGNMVVFLMYCYFLTKISDLVDTIIFVLRKRNNQISFLHVYHHIIMCSGVWTGVKFAPGGHGVMLGLLNTFVHSFMYFYYFLTSFNKDAKNWIKWKKGLTILQIVQFFLLTAHFGGPLVLPVEGCNYPKILMFTVAVNSIFMIFMFSDFYVKAYIIKKKKQ